MIAPRNRLRGFLSARRINRGREDRSKSGPMAAFERYLSQRLRYMIVLRNRLRGFLNTRRIKPRQRGRK